MFDAVLRHHRGLFHAWPVDGVILSTYNQNYLLHTTIDRYQTFLYVVAVVSCHMNKWRVFVACYFLNSYSKCVSSLWIMPANSVSADLCCFLLDLCLECITQASSSDSAKSTQCGNILKVAFSLLTSRGDSDGLQMLQRSDCTEVCEKMTFFLFFKWCTLIKTLQ